MNPTTSGYGGAPGGHSNIPQFSPTSNLQHLQVPKHPQTQPHPSQPHSPYGHSPSTGGYSYPHARQSSHPAYRTNQTTTQQDYAMSSDLSHKRKIETIGQQESQKRPRLTSAAAQNSMIGGPGGIPPPKSEGELKEELESEKWDVMKVMGLPTFLPQKRKDNELKDIPVAKEAPDPEARKAFVDKTALGQKMRMISHEFKLRVDDKTLQLVHDALLFALRDILDGLVTLYPSPRVYTVEDLLASLERNIYIHRKARDLAMRPKTTTTTTAQNEQEEEKKEEVIQ